MLKILATCSRYNVTKNILGAFPQMIANATGGVLQFFEQTSIKTIYMEKSQNLQVEFVGEQPEYIFTSHTSIIDGEILSKEYPEDFQPPRGTVKAVEKEKDKNEE